MSTTTNFSKVSIIVPVYNLEQYIDRCIKSILSQTYSNFELLLINDGSTDNSPSICDKYAKSDDRIVVIHQENQGVSVTRNKGIMEATGEWITFVDGDDWIEKDSLEKIIRSYPANVADVIYARSFANIGSSALERYHFNPDFTKSIQSGIYTAIDLSYLRGSVCGGLYRKNLLIEKNIFFPLNIKNGEDTIYSSLVLIYADKVGFADVHFYNVFEREGSASRSWSLDRVHHMLNNIKYINEYIDKNKNLSTEAINILDYNKYRIVSSMFNAFAETECVKLKDLVNLAKEINKLIDTKLDIGKIKFNKKKVNLFNLSTILYAGTVVINRKARNRKNK